MEQYGEFLLFRTTFITLSLHIIRDPWALLLPIAPSKDNKTICHH